MEPDRTRLLMQAELDGEIDAASEAELRQVMSESPELEAEARELAALSALIREDRDQLAPPTGLSDRIMAGLETAPEPAGRVFRMSDYLRPLGQVAAILVLVGAAFWMGSQTTSAAGDSLETQVLEDMTRLLEENPGLDQERLRETRDRYLEEIRRIEAEAETEKSQAAERFEERIRRLLQDLETGESR